MSTRTRVSIVGTLAASTCRSGSARLMAVPSSRLTPTISHSLRERVSFAPMLLPMRDMAMSAPSVKSPIPAISRIEPSRKASSSPLPTGTKARHSSATIAVIGITESAASLSFSRKARVFSKTVPPPGSDKQSYYNRNHAL